MFFISILILTTISIAGIAAFFSVYGLAQLFKGTFIAVIIMGASLEVGKLVTASFLYRYWNNLGTLMKSYLISAVVVLMIITSMGIFGMLSMGYQTDILPLKDTEVAVSLLKSEQEQLMFRKKEIDTQIAALPSDFVKGRQKLMRSFDPEVKVINKRLPEISTELRQLNSKLIATEAHIGPIVYIARAMGEDTDTATKYLILLIIVVFDPLAVALTIGVNMALRLRKEALLGAPIVTTPPEPPPIEVENHNTVDVTVDNKVADVLTLDSDSIKKLVSEELHLLLKDLPKEKSLPDPTVTELSRRNQIVANLRNGLS